jgi:pSer/pThr/pTyr-binding forkhead associated (FHA) protein
LLVGFCRSDSAPALLRPLVPTCSLILKLLSGQATPAAAAQPLREANAFLAGSSQPETLMDFALTVSNRECMQSFAWNMKAALAALCQAKGLRETAPMMRAALAQAHRDLDGLAELGQEIWELHAYFVFLDVKGDRALLEIAAAQLCRALRCTAKDLILGVVRTGRWVEEALGALAAQACGEMLEQHHVKALQQWRAAWAERAQCSPELHRQCAFGADDGKHGEWFWVNYFQQRWSATWAGFLDRFESFYLRGRCPADVVEQLRAELDPNLTRVVRREDWHTLVKGHDNVASLIDSLLSKVLADIGGRIYRSQPLDAGLLVEEAARSTGAAAEASSVVLPPEGPSCRPTDGRRLLKRQPRSSSRGEAGVRDSEGNAARLAKDGAMCSAVDGVHECEQEEVEPFPQSQIVTPLDPRGISLSLGEDKHMTWSTFCREHSEKNPCWWNAGKRLGPHQRALQAKALAAVSSSLAFTRRALVLREVSGSLADSRLVLHMPGAPERSAIVVTANDRQVRSGETHPIALHSHFDVVYEPTSDSYSIMDVGSKWGTFVKVTHPLCLSCGDWIRVGKAELVIRCCGGGCANHRCRAQKKISSLRQFGMHRSRPEGATAVQCCEEREAEDALQSLLGGVPAPGWPTPSVQARARASLVPVPPLEIDFIAGPRMGEKFVLTKRVSTMGRSDTSTVQITDTVVTNISRIHCVFEYIGSRWHLRDNSSTNGTWQRLSCVLQPSAPKPVSSGMSVLAGAHELLVEEAELTHWWMPSAACGVLEEMAQRLVRSAASRAAE